MRETEAIARLLSGRAQAKETGKNKRVPAPASFKKAARGLTRFLSVPVRVKTVQGKNKIEIQFKDEAELERILNLRALKRQKLNNSNFYTLKNKIGAHRGFCGPDFLIIASNSDKVSYYLTRSHIQVSGLKF